MSNIRCYVCYDLAATTKSAGEIPLCAFCHELYSEPVTAFDDVEDTPAYPYLDFGGD